MKSSRTRHAGNASLLTGAVHPFAAAQESGVPSSSGGTDAHPGNATLPNGVTAEISVPFWHNRGYLPHFECASAIPHITFHLADSLPSDILDRLQVELATISPDRLDAERRQRLEAWIDAGHGSCLLREPEIAALVEGALHFFDGQRYRLLEWVVMPNHVHVLIEQLPEWTVAKIVASWKKFTARKIVAWQHAHASAPGAVWHREYWDRFIRNQDHYQAAVTYIRSNPVKAGLVQRPEEWPWGSARMNASHPGNASVQTGSVHPLRAAQESGVPSISGIVLDIFRGSLHDGPGIRTTVFLKGCPLACLWCHNPESQSGEPVLLFTEARCVRCGACAAACAQDVHSVSPACHVLDRSRCVACGRCAAACPTRALEVKGRTLSVAQVMTEVLPDIDYYRATGGGLTLSGGEPMLQVDFTAALLQAARERQIHTVLETCGWAPADAYERVLSLVDLFLFDWKGADSARHAVQTGVPNEPIRRNLDLLARAGARIQLRCPLVPGVNDSEADLACIATLSRTYSVLVGIEIMPYHHMGNEKARRVGLDVRLDQPDAHAQTKTAWRERLQALGCRAAMIT